MIHFKKDRKHFCFQQYNILKERGFNSRNARDFYQYETKPYYLIFTILKYGKL